MSRGAALEQAAYHDDTQLTRHFGKCVGRRAGNGLGEREMVCVFGLAEVRRAKQFGQTHNTRALRVRFSDSVDGFGHVSVRVRRHRELDEA